MKVFLRLIIIATSIVTLQALGENSTPLKKEKWPFEGPFGYFDKTSIQRGFKVYKEVCQTCHSLKFTSYRDLEKVGFSKEEVKAIAAEYSINSINDTGDSVKVPATINDKFVSPFANELAARAANNGALPPDLSLIIKARPDGANYLYSLLTGYSDAPSEMTMASNMYYNPFFPSKQISMPPPLAHGLVSYDDGTQPSVEEMSRDVVNFLQWTAEPEMENRKTMGIKAVLYLAIFTAMFFFLKRKIWSKIK